MKRCRNKKIDKAIRKYEISRDYWSWVSVSTWDSGMSSTAKKYKLLYENAIRRLNKIKDNV